VELASALHLLAQARMERRMTGPALDAANEALRAFRELGNRRGEAMALLTVADAHVLQEEGGDASRAASIAAKLFEKLGEKAMRAGALNTLSNARILKGDSRGALKAANEARDIFKELGDAEAEAFTQDCIGQIQDIAALASSPADAPAKPSQDLKILEVGAGTGATSASVLPQLNPWATQYVFTDLSNAFLRNAKQRFATAFPFVEFALYDGEKHPAEQGFCPHSFDVVLGTNVIHATSHLPRTLGNIRTILRPGGHFVLNELSSSDLMEDLTFGLTDGWWTATDVERRPTYPLLNVREWEELLVACGFTVVYVRPEGTQAVIVAQESGMVPLP